MKRIFLILLVALSMMAAKVPDSVSISPTNLSFGSNYEVNYSTNWKEPWAEIRCYANETSEYTQTYLDGTIWGATFSLWEGGPTGHGPIGESIHNYWTGGGADCTLDLVKYNRNLVPTVLASSTFTVN